MTKEQVEERIYGVNLYYYFDERYNDFNESLKKLTISSSKEDTEQLFEFLHKLLVEMCFSDNEFKQYFRLMKDRKGHYFMCYIDGFGDDFDDDDWEEYIWENIDVI